MTNARTNAGTKIATAKDDFTIRPLADRPDLLPVLRDWYMREWAPWYGPEGGGDAERDLRNCLGGAALPRCYVALDSRERPVATAALRRESLGSDRWPGVWLCALLVRPDARRRGIATALVAHLEQEAAQLGAGRLYCSTAPLARLLRRRRWRRLGEVRSLRGPVDIFCLDLCGKPGDTGKSFMEREKGGG